MRADVADTLAVAVGSLLLGAAGAGAWSRAMCRRRALDAWAPLRRIGSAYMGILGVIAVAAMAVGGAAIIAAPRSMVAAVVLAAVGVTLASTTWRQIRHGRLVRGRSGVGRLVAGGTALLVSVRVLASSDGSEVETWTRAVGAMIGVALATWLAGPRVADEAHRAGRALAHRVQAAEPTARPTVRTIRKVVHRDVEPQATQWADLAWWAATVTPSRNRSGAGTHTVTVPGRRGQLRAVTGGDDTVTLVLVCPGAPVSGVSACLPMRPPAPHAVHRH